jgi:hypothetical protein
MLGPFLGKRWVLIWNCGDVALCCLDQDAASGGLHGIDREVKAATQ